MNENLASGLSLMIRLFFQIPLQFGIWHFFTQSLCLLINSYRNETDCRDCTPGWYCDGSGLPVPRGLCAPGYYCTGRAKDPNQHECPRGHKCPEGSPNPVPCEAGRYQNETTQATCRICPPGFYCNDTYGPVISYGQFLCIEGHYCPGGTKYAEEFKCPPGTFNNRTGMDEQSDCRTCTGGMVCDEWGLVTPYKLCGAGYFCREGANSTTPNLGEKADICPAGFYCPQGTGHFPVTFIQVKFGSWLVLWSTWRKNFVYDNGYFQNMQNMKLSVMNISISIRFN